MAKRRVSPAMLEGHLRHLTEKIGVRLAGTPGEASAARYVSESFEALGLEVCLEEFPVRSRRVAEERLEVLIGDTWERFPCSLFSSTPGTSGEVVEAPMEFFEAPAQRGARDLSRLSGKAVVHLGCHIESREAYRRLIESKPAFLLMVDVRYPGDVPLADGMFPSYTRDVGAVPTVNVAYADAWKWCVRRARAARLLVRGGMEDGVSQNVIGELPAVDPKAGVLYVGAHHDTQADSPGADDNASGVAGLLELARVLGPRERRRSIRLVSFGAEEQLSVGSATHVRRHRHEVAERGVLMWNLDSYGSPMGWNELTLNGPPELADHVGRHFAARGVPARITREILPYADHFPFVAAGVPGITLMRLNCAAGRFFHHRADDDMSRVSWAVLAEVLDVVAELLGDLAGAVELPFPRAVPEEEHREVDRRWRDLFGGW